MLDKPIELKGIWDEGYALSLHSLSSIPIYDDLFITRGLSKEDLQNYVIVGQFLELKEL